MPIYLNNNSNGGAIDVPKETMFTTNIARDAYFNANPEQLVVGAYCLVGTNLQKYLITGWVEYGLAIKGEKGDKGDKGATGEKGDFVKGDQGVQGIQGVQGEKGNKGDKGNRGEQGIQGVEGERGITGKKGDKGDMGAVSGVELTHLYESTRSMIHTFTKHYEETRIYLGANEVLSNTYVEPPTGAKTEYSKLLLNKEQLVYKGTKNSPSVNNYIQRDSCWGSIYLDLYFAGGGNYPTDEDILVRVVYCIGTETVFAFSERLSVSPVKYDTSRYMMGYTKLYPTLLQYYGGEFETIEIYAQVEVVTGATLLFRTGAKSYITCSNMPDYLPFTSSPLAINHIPATKIITKHPTLGIITQEQFNEHVLAEIAKK